MTDKVFFIHEIVTSDVQFLANVNSRSGSLGLYVVFRPSVVDLSIV